MPLAILGKYIHLYMLGVASIAYTFMQNKNHRCAWKGKKKKQHRLLSFPLVCMEELTI